jgi:hypothetical protein
MSTRVIMFARCGTLTRKSRRTYCDIVCEYLDRRTVDISSQEGAYVTFTGSRVLTP